MAPKNRPTKDTKPINTPDVEWEDKQRQLEGRRPKSQQDAFLEQDDLDSSDELTPNLQNEAGPEVASDEYLETLLENEVRPGETLRASEAAEEGLTYIPPIDPPTIPDNEHHDTEVASGTAYTAFDTPYDEDHHQSFLPAGDEMSARVREALRADSRTAQLAGQITIVVKGKVAKLHGTVDDLVDSDMLVAVASEVVGIEEVIDETRVRALE
ncbi:MAG: hypothetical protein HC893_16065 [Chloroflexaceae bacterium]|nr:hypothetical protein [Chloroflexaceae bacterium]NJL35086.1 hypothetical protein [Chloroflexaceae bacterium]NJO04820.1 hypothetical protein [Chloroflexaceae bacterium]